MRRNLVTGLVVVLLAVGFWQFGQGFWIYAKATFAQYLLKRAWVRTVEGEARVKPWPWADTWPVARLQAPAHGVDLIVLANASGRTLAFGPGLTTEGTGHEIDGPTVISAHRDTHFRFLKHLHMGDELRLHLGKEQLRRYRIVERHIVDARTAAIVNNGDQTSLILVTCYPFETITSGGPFRYVVVAEKLLAE